jgi:TIR domain
MKLFVSHSLSDKKLLEQIKETLEPYGIKLLVAEHEIDISNTITQKIEDMILKSDIAIILLTENGFNSSFVQQEIGYIKSVKKPFVQLVESGFEKKLSGFSFGRDFILYNPNSPEEAIKKTKKVLINSFKKLQEKRLKKSKQNMIEIRKKKQEEKQLKIGLGVLAGVIALGIFYGD